MDIHIIYYIGAPLQCHIRTRTWHLAILSCGFTMPNMYPMLYASKLCFVSQREQK